MMKNSHLEEEQVIRAIVDETDLPGPLRRHLSECSLCDEKRKGLERELQILGKMSRSYAPAPPRRRIWSENNSFHFSLWTWQKSLTAGAIALTALFLVISLWFGLPHIGPEKSTLDLQDTAIEEERLYIEALGLEKNPFSPFHQFMMGGSYTGLSEDFVNFVSPAL